LIKAVRVATYFTSFDIRTTINTTGKELNYFAVTFFFQTIN